MVIYDGSSRYLEPANTDSSVVRRRYQNEDGSWRTDIGDQWALDHPIDPNTGMISGPFPLVPANEARGYQAIHDRAIFRQRQNYLNQGVQYGQGALGLLQSYRPGGSAALEAGIYQGLGQMEFQRAQLTQPMDLLSDLRRHEGAVAASRANRAQERQIAVQVGTAVATLASAYIGGAGGIAAQGALAGIGGTANALLGASAQRNANQAALEYGGQQATATYSSNGRTLAQAQSDPVPQTAPNVLADPTQGIGGQNGNNIQLPPGESAQQSVMKPEDMPGEQALQSNVQPGQPDAPLPGTQGGQGGMQGPANAATLDGPGEMVGAAPGASGDFSGTAYAAGAAMAPSIAANPMAQVYLMDVAADIYEQDPFYQTVGFAINSRWRDYMGASA